ncbi:hypothetical protein EJB05_51281, partial [Eragrostis curvula]
MAMTTAKLALLLVVLVQVVSILAAAARPLEGDAAGTNGGGWLERGIGMVTQMLGAAKSRASPKTHCC